MHTRREIRRPLKGYITHSRSMSVLARNCQRLLPRFLMCAVPYRLAVAALVVAVVVVLAVLVTVRDRRHSVARDELIGASWDAAVRRCTARNASELLSGHSALVYVSSVYQYARTGSKAYLVWPSDNHAQDAWFWNWHANAGWFLELSVVGRATWRTNERWGVHNDHPGVLYLDPEVIVTSYPGDSPQAWTRMMKRRAAGEVGAAAASSTQR